eukprot:CAMPEP_0204900592 /NCGR_PEP_ID=MMETSP1397-20131031/2563_1 /ASSEMBLY_ACC=CAM_ASM_000891 /TAXON_ID=49980 /ORGANISM="Climacostomum Climacostomum virens, Strain Stock W-24" /LENGTH=94 /DNA_ID=CAMNT_0052068765 /DNA_START=549 /DNA_END=836 /DNA_ORIENTATION=+
MCRKSAQAFDLAETAQFFFNSAQASIESNISYKHHTRFLRKERRQILEGDSPHDLEVSAYEDAVVLVVQARRTSQQDHRLFGLLVCGENELGNS